LKNLEEATCLANWYFWHAYFAIWAPLNIWADATLDAHLAFLACPFWAFGHLGGGNNELYKQN